MSSFPATIFPLIHLAPNILLVFIIIFSSSSYSTATHSPLLNEGAALLGWKASLENQSQSLLPSWINNGSTNHYYCNWPGIGCNNASRITLIILNNIGLRGTLYNFSFSSFPYLVRFELCKNSLYGTIPTQIGNLSRLYYVDFSMNRFSGNIPSEIGNLRKLDNIYFYSNQLVGSIPQELGMLSFVRDLEFSYNNLTGPIPKSIWNLTNLVHLQLSHNSLSGSIPASIGNLKSLIDLILFSNKLSGSIPSELDNLTNLQTLSIDDNRLTGHLPQNLCRNGSLIHLGASNNNLTGNIPKSLRNCKNLYRVRLDQNQLEGNIQEEFGVPSLNYMDLSYNHFTGELSKKWGQSKNLTGLKISNNQITGKIPPDLAGATKLQFLDLSSNHLVGEIPRKLRELGLLFHLNLRNNKLSGNILAETFGSLSNLEDLDLAANNLTGSIPREIANCEKLRNLNLGENLLVGGIPFEIGKLQVLQSLDIGHNNLTGEIPAQLGTMQRLEKLNLSHNMLFGSIPSSFSVEPTSLISVDISYNNLKGHLPNTKAFENASFQAYKDNNGLCGNKTGLKPCSSPSTKNNVNKLVLFVAVPLVGTLVLSLLVVVIFRFLGKRVVLKAKREFQVIENENLFAIWSYDGKMVYENIIKATDDFSDKYCIGQGGYGTVYRADLPDGQVVAVKKVRSSQDDNFPDLKCFESEIRALTEARHRNIIKLYGFCSNPHRSFLVYEFLEGGNLKNKLNNEKETFTFEWSKRMNAIKGVASGLSYMHHECSPPIIHRDISSKNILFDSQCVAHISDFGTARLLNLHSSDWTSFAGTFGYAAPELAYTMEVNAKLDVFSFGVLMLEVLMGRHPCDLISSLSSSPSIVHGILLKDVLDNRLPPPGDQVLKEVVIITKLALACINTNPHLRPSIRQVSTELSKQKPSLKGSFHTITLAMLLDINSG